MSIYENETIVEPKCPTCGGKVWDNRETKRNPKAPDYKCRDRNCDGVIWPPRNGAPAPVAPAPVAVRPVHTNGYDAQGRDFLDRQETGAPPAAQTSTKPAVNQWDKLFSAYDVCLDHALVASKKMEQAQVGSSPESVAAIAATLLIQADRQGLTR